MVNNAASLVHYIHIWVREAAVLTVHHIVFVTPHFIVEFYACNEEFNKTKKNKQRAS